MDNVELELLVLIIQAMKNFNVKRFSHVFIHISDIGGLNIYFWRNTANNACAIAEFFYVKVGGNTPEEEMK